MRNTSLYSIQTIEWFLFCGKMFNKIDYYWSADFLGCWLEFENIRCIRLCTHHSTFIYCEISVYTVSCCVKMAFSYAALDKSLLYCSCFHLLINNFHNLCLFLFTLVAKVSNSFFLSFWFQNFLLMYTTNSVLSCLRRSRFVYIYTSIQWSREKKL